MWAYKKIKNNDAPLACIYRINQPLSVVSIVLVTSVNLNSILGLYAVARSKPDTICIARHINNSEPKFHRYEMLLGAGKVTAVDFTILNNGLFL